MSFTSLKIAAPCRGGVVCHARRLVLIAVVLMITIVMFGGCTSVHLGHHVSCELSGEVATPWPLADSGLTLHLISWNLHGTPAVESMDQRLANLTQVLMDRRPDLVLLQEVWFRGDATSLGHALESAYQTIEDEPTITRHLLGWAFGFRKAGLLAFRRKDSLWTTSGSSSFQPFEASASKWLVWQMDGIATKGIQRFEIEQAGVRVVVFNTHLQSPYRADEDPFGKPYPYDRERRRQIRQLGREAGQVEVPHMAVVTGDFNTTPQEQDVYAELANAFTDLARDYRQQCKCGTIVDETGQRKEWIDYVLTRPVDAAWVNVERWRLIPNFKVDCPFSDHHGLEVRLRLTPPRQ